jgi:hypothetical protein
MKNKYILALLLLTLIPFVPINSQKGSSGSRDKYTLLTMPYNKRPLFSYRGQFRVNTGYEFAVRGRSYDAGGDLIDLKDNGTGSVIHYYFIEIKYGITDFIEMAVKADYMKKGVRSETEEYWSGTDTKITINNLAETRGMGDVLLLATARLPLEYKWFDLGLSGGIYLPTAKFEPPKPSHTITDATGVNIYTINYHYNYTNGYGIPVYLFSAAAKVSLSKFSVSSNYTIRIPSKEGENIRWDQSLTNKNFTYTSNSYLYLLNRSRLLNISAHFQAAGWFDINLNSSFFKSADGWTEYMGAKYKNPEQKVFTLEPGFEIQISPSVTIFQTMSFPISGKNIDAPFYLLTTVSFNMFPFLK